MNQEKQTETCDCLTRLPEEWKNKLNKTEQFNGSINKITFRDATFVTTDWRLAKKLKTDLELDISTRKTNKNLPVFFNYCPFCGIKYN